MRGKILRLWWSLFVCIPLLVVWFGGFVLAEYRGCSFDFCGELFPRIAQTVLSGLPFAILLLFTKHKLKTDHGEVWMDVLGAGTGVITLMTCLWGYYYYDAISRIGGGPNIGLGILMLFSPFGYVVAMYVGFYLVKTARQLFSHGAKTYQ